MKCVANFLFLYYKENQSWNTEHVWDHVFFAEVIKINSSCPCNKRNKQKTAVMCENYRAALCSELFATF